MILDQFVTIYIPEQYIGREDVGSAVRDLTEQVGGSTEESAVGTWIDPEDGSTHMDRILKITWWMDDSKKLEASVITGKIILELLKAGEKSVMIERGDSAGHKVAIIPGGTDYEGQ